MKNNIKVIIFDLGGVLVPEKRDLMDNHISRFLKIKEGDLKRFSKNLNNELTKGEIDLSQFYSGILKKINNKEISPSKLVQKHIALYKKYCIKRDASVLRLIRRLKKRYLVVCLVNTELEIAKINKENGLYNIFLKSFISTEMKMMKPSLNIYKMVLRRLRIKSEKAVFIDDKEKNVNSARKLGINSILYKNFRQLKKDLKTFGLSI